MENIIKKQQQNADVNQKKRQKRKASTYSRSDLLATYNFKRAKTIAKTDHPSKADIKLGLDSLRPQDLKKMIHLIETKISDLKNMSWDHGVVCEKLINNFSLEFLQSMLMQTTKYNTSSLETKSNWTLLNKSFMYNLFLELITTCKNDYKLLYKGKYYTIISRDDENGFLNVQSVSKDSSTHQTPIITKQISISEIKSIISKQNNKSANFIDINQVVYPCLIKHISNGDIIEAYSNTKSSIPVRSFRIKNYDSEFTHRIVVTDSVIDNTNIELTRYLQYDCKQLTWKVAVDNICYFVYPMMIMIDKRIADVFRTIIDEVIESCYSKSETAPSSLYDANGFKTFVLQAQSSIEPLCDIISQYLWCPLHVKENNTEYNTEDQQQ